MNHVNRLILNLVNWYSILFGVDGFGIRFQYDLLTFKVAEGSFVTFYEEIISISDTKIFNHLLFFFVDMFHLHNFQYPRDPCIGSLLVEAFCVSSATLNSHTYRDRLTLLSKIPVL